MTSTGRRQVGVDAGSRDSGQAIAKNEVARPSQVSIAACPAKAPGEGSGRSKYHAVKSCGNAAFSASHHPLQHISCIIAA